MRHAFKFVSQLTDHKLGERILLTVKDKIMKLSDEDNDAILIHNVVLVETVDSRAILNKGLNAFRKTLTESDDKSVERLEDILDAIAKPIRELRDELRKKLDGIERGEDNHLLCTHSSIGMYGEDKTLENTGYEIKAHEPTILVKVCNAFTACKSDDGTLDKEIDELANLIIKGLMGRRPDGSVIMTADKLVANVKYGKHMGTNLDISVN